MNSKDTGDATEAKTIHVLIEHGYSVSIPFGDNDKYDLVVETDEGFERIQCKTGWMDGEDVMWFNTCSKTTEDGDDHYESYKGEIDAFVVRNSETDQLYWVDVEDAGKSAMRLRYEAGSDHPSINWAEDFEFDGHIE